MKVKGLDYLSNFELLIILSLLLLCNDIEKNPGPSSESPSEISFTSSDTSTLPSDINTKNKFSVVHYNVQSLVNKIGILETELSNFDVICITESWLHDAISDGEIKMEEYTVFRRDRVGDSHGGVCVYVKNNLHVRRRNDIEIQNLECVWIEITTHNKKVLIGTFYRPPNSPNDTMAHIENSVGLAVDTNIQDILILGDFNLDILKQLPSRKINNVCQYFGLDQLISEPTHFTETSSSVIDLIFTSNKNNVFLSGIGDPFLHQNMRYHCPVYCVFNFEKCNSGVFTRNIWLYDRGNYEDLTIELNETNWNNLKNDNINIYAQNITDTIISAAKRHVPNKNIKVRQSDPPWLNNTIKKMIRKRKRLFNKFKSTRNDIDFQNYKRFRNKVTNAIRQSKKDHIGKLAENLKNNTKAPRDWWKTLKTFIKPTLTTAIPPLEKNGCIYSDSKDKADTFNTFFADQSLLDDSNASLPGTIPVPQAVIGPVTFTPSEVEAVLKSLKTGKAAGPDAINNRLLIELAQPLASPLCDLFNFSLLSGKVPDIWKQANVTPIHKKNDPTDVSNYRPISLLSTIGKVIEKLVHKHVFNFFRDHEILTALQSGFVEGDSTINQLVDIYNSFCKALDDGKEVRAIFFDISKAFDRVWHKGLLYKLQTVGITGSLLQWFTDYLYNRKQRVVLPGGTSDWTTISAGVPQGSILGPLLFLVYINDIVEDINSFIRLFADDTSLYIIVENPFVSAEILNSDIAKVHRWATEWLVTFNPLKTEEMIFSRKLNKPQHPPIHMNQQPISQVSSHKHLGLIFSEDLSWHDHFELIKSKAWNRINIMRKLKFQLDRKSLQTIYFSFIRPLLEYADVIWDNCFQYEANELEKIQNEAARIVTGATKLVSINNLLKETGWELLSTRRKKHKLSLFYKMNNGLCPSYLTSLVPPTVGNNTIYSLRNATNIQTIHARSQLYYNSFLPSVIRDWNTLPMDTRNANSLNSFKYKLNTDIKLPPVYFNDGTRHGQIYHSRLRTGCSSLNSHLYAKHLIDSPLCICGEVEDTNHYLLQCDRYADLRRDMLNTITTFCPPTFNTLIWGNSELSLESNKEIFLSVQNFILKSKRFKIQ